MHDAPVRGHVSVGVLFALVLGVASLAGCSQLNQMSSEIGLGQDLTVASGDPCGRERAAFAKSNDFFTADVLKSAGISALVGGIGGAAIGGALGGQRGAVTGGLVGVVGGAVASLTISYASYMQQQYGNDPRKMADGINSDLVIESRARDQTITNFRNLRSCRLAQARSIHRQLGAGRISRAEAQRELDAEHAWFDQEIAVAQHWGVNMRRRDEQFQAATTELQQKAPARSRTAVVAATETNPDKRQVLESNVGTAQRDSQVAFNLESQGAALMWRILYG